jgi:DNA-binding IclR family transcriptional regulator
MTAVTGTQIEDVTMLEQADAAGGSRSVERALRLLHVVATAEEGITLSAASRAVDLPTSTVARLLKTLEGAGFLQRDTSGHYRGGSKILQIGAIALGSLALYKMAEPHLHELSEYTGETAYLAVPDGEDTAVYLRQVESPRAIRHATWTGRAINTASTALGAVLAGRVGEEGFVVSRGTRVEPDAAAAAAPILDSRNTVIGALSVIGPSFRISEDDLVRFGKRVRLQAERLSDELRMIPGGSRHTLR